MCKHKKTVPYPCDQTLGVKCLHCGEHLYECWNSHIPEDAWNSACKNDKSFIPCEKSRKNVCAVCKETF